MHMMEPPAKRLRLSPRDTSDFIQVNTNSILNEGTTYKDSQDTAEAQHVFPQLVPTRTIDLNDFGHRALEQRGLQPKRNAGVYLAPRMPDVTVTANVVNIAILDDSSSTQMTEIAAPTVDIAMTIANLGTLTVPGVSAITAGLNPVISSITSNILPGETTSPSATDSLSSSSSFNGTSSSTERTVTVTATSTFEVSFLNGTAHVPTTFASSHHRTTVLTDGVTRTLDVDGSSSTDGTNSWAFGDFTASTTTSSPANNNNLVGGIAPTATTTSGGPATSTDSGPGPGVVLTPQQQQMVGGLVGGVAGVALVLLALLYFLKWYRQRLKAQGRLPEQIARHRQLPSGDHHEYVSAPTMSQSSKSSILPIATLRQSLQKFRPHSIQTVDSNTTDRSLIQAPESERSFQRVSGRKIPSVLLSGGDGYDSKEPGSPPSEYGSFSRSRDVSQTSSFRESNKSSNPLLPPGAANLLAGYNTSSRSFKSPFADPPTDGLGGSDPPALGTGTSARDFAVLSNNQSQLTLQTAGLSALSSKRRSEPGLTIRPSPARTPTTASPTSSSLKLPMHTPPMMSGDIPEMPSLHTLSNHINSGKASDGTLSAQRSIGHRSMSAYSVRSSVSVGGKFKEDIT